MKTNAVALSLAILLGGVSAQAATHAPAKATDETKGSAATASKAHKPAAAKKTAAGEKPVPSCAAISFRAVPAGATDGEQEAGSYRSRRAKLALKATVKQGEASDYYMTANGTRIGAATGGLPASAENCAVAKKLPKPEKAAASCTGQRFRFVVNHAGDKRLGLLYAENGGVWQFCSAGGF